MAGSTATKFDLAAAVAAGIKSGVKCDRCHDPHADKVSLHDWRMEWFKAQRPAQQQDQTKQSKPAKEAE